MNLADIEKQANALDVEVQQPMQSKKHDVNREFEDFMGVLDAVVSELNLNHPGWQVLSPTLPDLRNKTGENGTIDKPESTREDVSMTDLSRQQVTDLLAAAEAETGARLSNFQLDIKSGFADLRTQFAQVRTEMANDREAAAKRSNESQRWIVTAVFAMISIAVAVIGAMINFSKVDKPVAVPLAPIIITITGSSQVPSQSAPTASQAKP